MWTYIIKLWPLLANYWLSSQTSEQACQHGHSCLHKSLFARTGTAPHWTSSAVLPTVPTMQMWSPLVGQQIIFTQVVHKLYSPRTPARFVLSLLVSNTTSFYSVPSTQSAPRTSMGWNSFNGEKITCLNKKEQDQVVPFKKTGLGSFFFFCELYARLKKIECKDRKDRDGYLEMEKQVTLKSLWTP